MSKFLDSTGITALWNKIKSYVADYSTPYIEIEGDGIFFYDNEVAAIGNFRDAEIHVYRGTKEVTDYTCSLTTLNGTGVLSINGSKGSYTLGGSYTPNITEQERYRLTFTFDNGLVINKIIYIIYKGCSSDV